MIEDAAGGLNLLLLYAANLMSKLQWASFYVLVKGIK